MSCLAWFPLVFQLAFAAVPAVPPAQREAAKSDAPQAAMVRVWNRDIVEFRASIGTLTPQDRVQMAVQHIQELPDTALQDAIHYEPATLGDLEGLVFRSGTKVLFALLRTDLNPLTDESLEKAGEQVVVRLGEVLRARAEQRSLPILVKGVSVTLGGLVALTLLILAVVWARRRLLAALPSGEGRTSRFRIGGLDLQTQVRGVLGRLIKGSSWLICLIAAYSWVTTSLSLFPYTAPWGQALGDWVFDTFWTFLHAIVNALPGLATVVVIFIITRWIVKLVGGIFLNIERRRVRSTTLSPEIARATRRLLNLVIWIFALVFAYPYLPGSDSDAFKGMSVLLGLMVSLGSAGFVNQIMSGFVVLYSRSVELGDQVRIGTTEGIVREIGFLSTKVITASQEEITIPNAVVVTGSTVNFSRRARGNGAVAAATITIGYDAPWRQVHALLLLAASRTEGVQPEPAPYVLQRALGDFYVEYQLVVEIASGLRRMVVLSNLHAQIQDAFNEHGVQILSPHFEKQPEHPVVVPRERWAPPPAAEEVAAARSGESTLDSAGRTAPR